MMGSCMFCTWELRMNKCLEYKGSLSNTVNIPRCFSNNMSIQALVHILSDCPSNMSIIIQGSHSLEKALNFEGCLEKALNYMAGPEKPLNLL